MANTSTLIGTLDTRIGGRGVVFVVKTDIDATGDHTVVTPNGTILDTAGATVTLPAGRFWIVGCTHLDATPKAMALKSGANELTTMTFAANGGIRKDSDGNSFWLAGLGKNQPLVVNLSAFASPKSTILWHLVFADKFGV